MELTTERLEAFSDAVIAVIVTILALELDPPESTLKADVYKAIPPLLVYVLAFVYLAIWWNNHHHLFRATERINGAVMWANMALLFFLSLIPVATQWVSRVKIDESGSPSAFFGVVSLAAAIAYTILVRMIVRANGPESLVARSLQGNTKGNVSLLLYIAAIVGAAVTRTGYLSFALYAAVAIIWLIPDRRFTKDARDGGTSSSSAPGHAV